MPDYATQFVYGNATYDFEPINDAEQIEASLPIQPLNITNSLVLNPSSLLANLTINSSYSQSVKVERTVDDTIVL